MFKKLISSILFVIISPPLFAGYTYLAPSIFLQSTTAPNSNFRGIAPRAAFGYEDQIDNSLFLAGEIFVSGLTIPIADNNNTNATSVKITRTFGASLMPSTMINDEIRGFLRLGVLSSKFDGPNTSTTGVEVGLGAQFSIADKWDMRTEYTYQAYHAISSIGSAKSSNFGIGLVRKFI